MDVTAVMRVQTNKRVDGMLKRLSPSGGSLYQSVFEALERAILNGTLKSGESLAENKLSEQLGVSRTPVREALRQLELEGLVRSVPNKGAVVIGVTRQDIEDCYLIRMRVEDLAVRRAAENILPEELEQLSELLSLQKLYAERLNFEKLSELDGAFHEQIYHASRSRQLEHLLTGLHHYVRHARSVSFKQSGRALKALEEHRDILKALTEHDPEAAAGFMVEHIANARDNLIAHLKSGEAII